MYRFIGVGIVTLVLVVSQQLFGTPERPAHATKLTIKEMCRTPNSPNWCKEYFMDLAYGKEVATKSSNQSESQDKSQENNRKSLDNSTTKGTKP
jgi:hypothetical protein